MLNAETRHRICPEWHCRELRAGSYSIGTRDGTSGKWDWLRAKSGDVVEFNVRRGACPTFRGCGAAWSVEKEGLAQYCSARDLLADFHLGWAS